MIEEGAYRRLLDLYYASERPLPHDRKALYRIARATQASERRAVDTVLAEYFEEQEDGWHQGRCDKEITKAHEKSDKASESANRRWHSEGNANASANAMRTHSDGNATYRREPSTNSQEPGSQKPKTSKPPKVKPVAGESSTPAAPTKHTWVAYSTAFLERYKTITKWSAMTGGLLANFVSRLGAEEAPLVAAFYLTHNGRYYVQNMHSIKAMVNDAEKLRTEWATGRSMTETEARMVDRTQTNANVWGKLIAEAKENEGDPKIS